MALPMEIKNWHIPLSEGLQNLGETYDNFRTMAADQNDIPLIVQLVENPKFSFPGINFFDGATDLKTHDYIHILLSRGAMPKDEAFVLGFTMGSTNKMTRTEEKVYSFCSQYLYPKVYQFSDSDIKTFKDAVRLGFISDCIPLDKVDYTLFREMSIDEAREAIGIEKQLLGAYFTIEKKRHPDSFESKRL